MPLFFHYWFSFWLDQLLCDRETLRIKMLKVIESHPRYSVDEEGNVWSFASHSGGLRLEPKKLEISKNHGGYSVVQLWKDRKGVQKRVSVLVLEAFVGPRPKNKQACHWPDSNKSNNKLTNLKWATKWENEKHKVAHGTDAKGERNPSSKLTYQQVNEIRSLRYNKTRFELSKLFAVSPSTIKKVLTRESWDHLAGPPWCAPVKKVQPDTDCSNVPKGTGCPN